MTSPSPRIEELFQQLIRGQKLIIEKLEETNTKLDAISKRVEDIELSQTMAVYPSSVKEEISSPLILNTKCSSQRSSLTNSEIDESSIANPINKKDLAAVLDAAAVTPILTKCRSASDHKDRRDSYFIQQLDTDENDTTIKYHTAWIRSRADSISALSSSTVRPYPTFLLTCLPSALNDHLPDNVQQFTVQCYQSPDGI
jgi:hypothetical protein